MDPKPRPKFIWLALFGGFAGGALSTWTAPKAIAWYFVPPVNIGIDCRGAVEWAMRKLQLAEFMGFSVGLTLATLFWFSRYWRWRQQKISEPTIQASEPAEPKF